MIPMNDARCVAVLRALLVRERRWNDDPEDDDDRLDNIEALSHAITVLAIRVYTGAVDG